MMRYFLTTLFALGFLVVTLSAEGIQSEFEAANKLFEQGQFAEAASAYEKLAGKGGGAAIWFNLGNARFRSSEVGKAIAAYRMAAALSPRDPDIRANLAFARGSIPNNTPAESTIWDRALSSLTLNEWAVMAVMTLWVWFGLLIARLIKPAWRLTLSTATRVSGISFGVAAMILAFAFLDSRSRAGVVVIADQTPVRFGPLAESQVAFTARDGSEYPILERNNNWVMVADASRKSGWIELSKVTAVP